MLAAVVIGSTTRATWPEIGWDGLIGMDENRHARGKHHHRQQRFVGGLVAEADVLRVVGDAGVAEPERDPADLPPRVWP